MTARQELRDGNVLFATKHNGRWLILGYKFDGAFSYYFCAAEVKRNKEKKVNFKDPYLTNWGQKLTALNVYELQSALPNIPDKVNFTHCVCFPILMQKYTELQAFRTLRKLADKMDQMSKR
jgi:hypothetical protein